MENLIVYGKSLETHLFEALSLINRELARSQQTPELLIKGLGANINKALAISSILEEKLNGKVTEIKTGTLKLVNEKLPDAFFCPVLDIKMSFDANSLVNTSDIQTASPPTTGNCFPYYFYQILIDYVIEKADNNQIQIRGYERGDEQQDEEDQNGNQSPVLKILATVSRDRNVGFRIRRGEAKDRNIHKSVAEAAYRAGILVPDNIVEIVQKLSQHDDIILGLDTNILYNCNISQHLLPLISILNSRRYFTTPNWMLIIIPNAVMHELEEAANIKNEKGYLQFEGRLAFRALQEIFYLAQNAEIPGLSVLITGEANPVLDTIIDLQGFRDYMFKRDMKIHSIGRSLMPKKRSTGDMIIRDQFKSFLRKIDFHKGTYFVTADKSNAALAETEGLNPVYIKMPRPLNTYIYGTGNPDFAERWLRFENLSGHNNLRFASTTGELIYELIVSRGTIYIDWQQNGEAKSVELTGDCRGERLENWVNKNIFVENGKQTEILLTAYQGIPLTKIHDLWLSVRETTGKGSMFNLY
jgi:DNA-binding protein